MILAPPTVERFYFVAAKGAPMTWICPGCGALVALPADCRLATDPTGDRRLDQLAQALCGCWVVNLPENSLVRLLGAIMAGEGTHTEHNRRTASGGG